MKFKFCGDLDGSLLWPRADCLFVSKRTFDVFDIRRSPDRFSCGAAPDFLLLEIDTLSKLSVVRLKLVLAQVVKGLLGEAVDVRGSLVCLCTRARVCVRACVSV